MAENGDAEIEVSQTKGKRTVVQWSHSDNLAFLEAWRKSDDPKEILSELEQEGITKFSLAQVKFKRKNFKFDAKGL